MMSNIIIVTLACDDDPQTGAQIVIEHVLIQLNILNGIWALFPSHRKNSQN